MVDALYGVLLVVEDSFKYLGVFVSNNFEWNMHIYDITSGTYQRVEITKRVLNKVSLKVKKSSIFNFLQTNSVVCLQGLGPVSC